MDAEQRGWYIQLLAEAWESEPQATLPNDDQLLRVLAGVNSSSTGVEQRWDFVRNQFRKRGAVVYNERQMEEVVRQEVNRQKKSEAGKASADARKQAREAIKNQHLTKGTRGNRRSTRVENVLGECSNRAPTESNSSIPSSVSIPPSEDKEPLPFSSPSFLEAWKDYVQARKEKRQRVTSTIQKALCKKMIAWGEERSIAALIHSTGYTGLFEPNGASSNGKRETTSERNVRNLRESLAVFQGGSGEDHSQESAGLVAADADRSRERVAR
jgi:uncharacterized protein YdaU (DUF1376 family)